jgi:hypothetical protein
MPRLLQVCKTTSIKEEHYPCNTETYCSVYHLIKDLLSAEQFQSLPDEVRTELFNSRIEFQTFGEVEDENKYNAKILMPAATQALLCISKHREVPNPNFEQDRKKMEKAKLRFENAEKKHLAKLEKLLEKFERNELERLLEKFGGTDVEG